MKKMFKAAASLAVGCALLSTSAFAAIVKDNSSVGFANGKIEVSVDGVGNGESTIMVLKSAEEITAIPATVDPANIVYIDQKTATAENPTTYSIDPGTRGAGVTDFYVFAGGSNDAAAVFLGKVSSAVVATGVTLSGTGIIAGEENAYTAAVDKDAALAITAAVSPETATNKTVTWAVTKGAVDVKASVLSAITDTGATFNAAEAGEYVLTATDSANHVATLTITVTDPVVPATGVTIKEGTEDAAETKVLEIGVSAAFTAAVAPTTSTDTVTWSVKQGETDVTATTLEIAATGVATFTAPTVEADTVYTVTATAGTVSDSIAITVNAPDAPSLPEGAAITVRNADPYDMAGYSVVKVTGITSGTVKIKGVDAYLADYSSEGGIAQYVAIVEGSSFTLDDITYDSTGTPETIVFGNADNDEDGTAGSTDSLRILQDAYTTYFENGHKAFLSADVDADGVVGSTDALRILQAVIAAIN